MASVPPEQALSVQLTRVTAPYQFDFVDWESQAIAGELSRRWSPPDLSTDEAGQVALVQTYLQRQQRLQELGQDIDQLYALCPEPSVETCPAEQRRLTALEQDVAGLKAAQSQIIPSVEEILINQTETILREAGFVRFGWVFPPVAFRLVDPPTALIISPRDRIENQHFIGLEPGLDNRSRAQIEHSFDRRGDVSSYVTDIGGLGSYPTMVVNYDGLPFITEVIAHEWTHNYLFTFPTNIAWGYQVYPKLTTINETTADIVGKEIGRQVILRYYPDWVDRLPPLDETGLPAPREPSKFDLAMRRIRQHVDQLLSAGKIEEAETYMEAERLKLVAQGYNLRKLNQAYFAFHGSYALSPASIDPIGPQLRRLRAGSASLKAFVDHVGWLNSYEDYLAWVAAADLD
jgi:hypothetical protein